MPRAPAAIASAEGPKAASARAGFAARTVRAYRREIASRLILPPRSNSGARSPIEAAILKGLGVRAGIPDVLALKAGRLCAIELKAPGGRLSPAQRETIAALKAAGARVEIADSLDDALDHLERWGILRGERQ